MEEERESERSEGTRVYGRRREGKDLRNTLERRRRKRQEDEVGEISKEEMDRVIRKLKDGKSAGGDDIVNEVWKYGGGEVREWLWKICNRVWKGECWSEEWREGIVVPILKKGKGVKVEEYRGGGVMLTQTAYKVYTVVLVKKLREEVKSGVILPPSQGVLEKGWER